MRLIVKKYPLPRCFRPHMYSISVLTYLPVINVRYMKSSIMIRIKSFSRISRSHPNNCKNKPGKALPRSNVNHLSIIAPSNKHVDCKIGYTTISTMLFACLSWKVHPPTAVTLYSPSDYWLIWLIKMLPIMWQKLTKKVEVWLLFVNLPTCTHPSVAQAGPSWFWSDPVHWYNNLKSYIHLLPNPTSANNLHSHKLQLPRHPPLNQSTDMTAIHKSNIYHNRLKPNNHTPSTAQPEDRESREPL